MQLEMAVFSYATHVTMVTMVYQSKADGDEDNSRHMGVQGHKGGSSNLDQSTGSSIGTPPRYLPSSLLTFATSAIVQPSHTKFSLPSSPCYVYYSDPECT